MTLWRKLGFRENPYKTEPIEPSPEGESLLVGRKSELLQISDRITSSGLHPTVEGDNGVGKSSLVSVATFRLFRDFEQKKMPQAIIPVDRSFQLNKDRPAEEFVREVFYAIADAFLKHHSLLKGRGFDVPRTGGIRKWLSTPNTRQWGAGASAAGFGGSFTASDSPNTSRGFADSGFEVTVRKWLDECFPSPQSGGFVCVIDNLELLETSKRAREVLESLRDPLLNQRGLRWVLCGARGIVRSTASSPRLEGRLSEPLVLQPVPHEMVGDIVRKRVALFRLDDEVKAPVTPEMFTFLYEVLNRNLRNALKYSEDFTFWLQTHGEVGSLELLQAWLAERSDRHIEDTTLTPRTWQLFDAVADLGGTASPSDYPSFDFESQQAMRRHVLNLENAGLVISVVDDGDKRRRSISLTPRGWLVRYGRNDYFPPQMR